MRRSTDGLSRYFCGNHAWLSFGSGEVTGVSIRLRILKGPSVHRINIKTLASYRGIDPFEDTESVIVVKRRVNVKSYRGIDPFEDTERFFIASLQRYHMSYRGIDPFEDTERWK